MRLQAADIDPEEIGGGEITVRLVAGFLVLVGGDRRQGIFADIIGQRRGEAVLFDEQRARPVVDEVKIARAELDAVEGSELLVVIDERRRADRDTADRSDVRAHSLDDIGARVPVVLDFGREIDLQVIARRPEKLGANA